MDEWPGEDSCECLQEVSEDSIKSITAVHKKVRPLSLESHNTQAIQMFDLSELRMYTTHVLVW